MAERWRIWEPLDDVDFSDRLPLSDTDVPLDRVARSIPIGQSNGTFLQVTIKNGQTLTASLIVEEI